jgi:hypothetical protein
MAFVVAAIVPGASCNSPLSPSSVATFTITAAGVTPKEVRIKAFNHVSFTNNDDRPHQIMSDPINEHTQCPAINEVGYLPPGSTRDTRTLSLTLVCGFHDHLNLLDDAFKGASSSSRSRPFFFAQHEADAANRVNQLAGVVDVDLAP